ncbi:MAG: hypothetical protein A2X86_02630 [Bdellovibrionales bacterium GWA2_49_15]|nr:MAG: hypothetical protein A2X86_02630 [Bdellovibrionales bacterium GWA2_49_15]HAZ14167.1 hypothetical protein [Bdellovibrionales bacterium]
MGQNTPYHFKSKNIFQNLLHEAEALQGLEQIELLVESGAPLSHVPLQPLYMAMRQLTPEQVGPILPRLSSEQRQAFLDIDLWKRDELDIEQFEYWIHAYKACEEDEVRLEFIKSSEFALFMKARFNVWTFDVEEPEYPEHDNYFLTDDSLLLFEFDEDCEYVSEVRRFIIELYADLGMENAYCYLFKMVSEPMSSMQEDEYRIKKGRLLDFGLVDYYDALELDNTFSTVELMHGHLKMKRVAHGQIDPISATQGLYHAAVSPFARVTQEFQNELQRVQSDERLAFLQFNFIKLVNGQVALSDADKENNSGIAQVGQLVRQKLELGFSYLCYLLENRPEILSLDAGESLFETFDLTDVYRVGLTLWRTNQRELNRHLLQYEFNENNETFLGQYWNNFLDDVLSNPPKWYNYEGPSIDVTNAQVYLLWVKWSRVLQNLLPFIKSFHDSFTTLVESGRLNNSFYMNYEIADMDFEAIILSSLANHWLGVLHDQSSGKMGLTVDEYRKFLETALHPTGVLREKEKIMGHLQAFTKQFGLDIVPEIEDYLYILLKMQIEGNQVSTLKDADYRHVGGPIILNIL